MMLVFWNWLDRYLFGEYSEGIMPGARALRLLRYPYALLRDLSRGQINLYAMGLVYATLLSLVPLIAFAFAVLKAFGAHRELEPIIYEFFKPMGASAGEFTRKVMEFADSVSTGVVGSLGLALLLWTLLGTIKKVEDGFNFLWRVEHARSFARRVTEYVALLIVGPIVVVSFIGLSHHALDTASAGFGRYVPFFERLVSFSIEVSPYFMVAAIFTAVYMFVPNTRVKWKPALIGGVAAGILWAAVGKLFTSLVVYSTRLTVVYAGFAIIVAALLWTYFGWLILLVGAQLSFYVQNRNYLRLGLTELRLSAVQREQLTLKVMFLIGRSYHDGKTRWSVDTLAHELGMPGIAISRIVHALEGAHLLTMADDERLLPARDLGQISIQEIVDIARNEKAGQVAPRNLKLPAVDAISKTMDDAWRKSCGEMTLRDLIEEA
ncbi:MAG TPA: YihY/virulence factor BrkB family protein [Steroidobacteraceae bacterium]|jgi:membrane protein|nr:YihY/virulence factor BrkB family protein [Steroidobacteraceae bacterium]